MPEGDRQVEGPATRDAREQVTYVASLDREATRAVMNEPDLARAHVDVARSRWKEHTRELLRTLFGEPDERDFAVRYWDGTTEKPATSAALTLVLQHPGALRRMLWPPTELRGAEAYIRNDIDLEGDLERAAVLGELLQRRIRPERFVRLVLPRLLALPSNRSLRREPSRRRWSLRAPVRKHSPERDKSAVRYHYDTGNDFFQLFLDERMVYSCAYFEPGRESLEAAQVAKLEHTCRKLRLAPGERLLDIGCGWGSLILHAAERYGVHALGITLSEAQAAFARERIAAAGLSDRCRVEVRDYRQLARDAQVDKVVSIGMVEHVGHGRVGEYFDQAYRVLRPGGLFLSHGITTIAGARPKPVATRVKDWLWRGRGLIKHYVFPDSELLPLGDHVLAAERAGFESRDAESLREHYAMTLRHWLRRLEAERDAAVRLVGDATYRVWRLYLAGSAHAFANARINVVQLLLAKPDAAGRSEVPLTRRDVYGQATR
ncbi:MAG: class I SAM-dependent methyltransferase [Gemmatimonadaceae bacterium]